MDVFLLKGSVFLVLAAISRAASCYWMFIYWKMYDNGKTKINKPNKFSALATEISLDVPLYLMLMVMFSLLFSTYRLYLLLHEMLGLDLEDEKDQEAGNQGASPSAASTGSTVEAGEGFLDKINPN